MPTQANLGYQGTGGPLRRRDILAAFVNYERHAVPLKIFLVKIDLRWTNFDQELGSNFRGIVAIEMDRNKNRNLSFFYLKFSRS